MNLGTVLQELHDSEINAGVQTFYDSNWGAWLGDDLGNGKRAECHGGLFDANDAANWLHVQALEEFPDSEYAKKFA